MTKCIDCLTEGLVNNRPAPHPGPRCVTHHRTIRNARKIIGHGRRLMDTYGITRAEYEALFEEQLFACAICRRARGVSRNLCVDHDHALEGDGVRGSVRGLLCSTCNKMLGHCRDDPEMLLRGVDYLLNPPARKVLG